VDLKHQFQNKNLSLKHTLFFTQYFSVTTLSQLQTSTTNDSKYHKATRNAVREIFLQRQETYDYVTLRSVGIFACWSLLLWSYGVTISVLLNCAYISIHSVVCLTTGPYPLPERFLHSVRSSASSLNFQYLLFSLRSSSSCLRLLPCFPVISILPLTFLQSRVLEGSFYARCDQSS
jgi:hypothetical protein